MEEVGNSTSRQSFRTWFAGVKIYVECFIPGRRVNKILPLVVPLFNVQYCQSKMDGINNSVYS